MKAGRKCGTKYVARIWKIMIAADSAMDTSAPWSALPIARHHRYVERAFRCIHHSFSAVDDACFVSRRPVPLTQGVLALFSNAFYIVGHGSHPFGLLV